MSEEKKVIQPITFDKPKQIRSAIEIIPKGQKEKPIDFIFHQQDAEGNYRECYSDDSRMAGLHIPFGVDIDEYLKKHSKQKPSEIAKPEFPASTITRVNPQNVIANTDSASEMANYQLFPIRLRVYVNRKGSVLYDKNEVEVKILIDGMGTSDFFKIKCSDIEHITRRVAKQYPQAILYDKRNAATIENDFRSRIRFAKTVHCYVDAGWQMIGDSHIYLSQNSHIPGSEIMTTLSLPVIKGLNKRDFSSIWTSMCSLYTDYSTSAVLCLYSLLGVTYRLFDEAGYPPRFLLFMTGKTGSFKTTLAKILFTQLADDEYRNYPRRIDTDTAVSLERGIVLSGRDTVTLIDDYSPAKTRQSAADLSNKLEAVIRMIGDGSSKSRSSVSLDDQRGEGVKGMVVLTGELHGKGLSSNLRCLFCEIEAANVNLKTVSYFQQNPLLITSFIGGFTDFLSANWDDIITFIKGTFGIYREQIKSTLSAKRLVDVGVILWLTADILKSFLISFCGDNESTASTNCKILKKDILSAVKRSEMVAEEENPALTFMKALLALMNRGELVIKDRKPDMHELMVLDGYTENGYTFLLPHNIYYKAVNWLRQGGIFCPHDETQIGALLCKDGYALSSSNGSGKRVYYARVAIEGKKESFLKFPNSVFQKLRDSD